MVCKYKCRWETPNSFLVKTDPKTFLCQNISSFDISIAYYCALKWTNRYWGKGVIRICIKHYSFSINFLKIKGSMVCFLIPYFKMVMLARGNSLR